MMLGWQTEPFSQSRERASEHCSLWEAGAVQRTRFRQAAECMGNGTRRAGQAPQTHSRSLRALGQN